MDAKLEEWLDWRERSRRKHRVMSVAEYVAWCRRGDAISDPSDVNALSGGITITFGSREDFVLGTYREFA